jgi:hypothetical protein
MSIVTWNVIWLNPFTATASAEARATEGAPNANIAMAAIATAQSVLAGVSALRAAVTAESLNLED